MRVPLLSPPAKLSCNLYLCCYLGLVQARRSRLQHVHYVQPSKTHRDLATIRCRDMLRSLGKEELSERIVRRFDGIPQQLIATAASMPLNLGAMALGMGVLWYMGNPHVWTGAIGGLAAVAVPPSTEV